MRYGIATSLFHFRMRNAPTPETWCSPWTQIVDRALIQAQLEKLPGKHLVIDRYTPQHSPMARGTRRASGQAVALLQSGTSRLMPYQGPR
jgi:hypothetical protein